ncbi:hypothetical protein ACQP2P_30125 [Dactylosporangium sp. CA-139114]|uniref:hypothetical protein n=1 Tax=Dactylosporangium sp. CA-139114 TaxID=3239931 RepID=UPI003D97B194
MMFEELRASDEVIAGWRELARQVRDALEHAGIPPHLTDDYPGSAGARVDVDCGNDEMGGVFVVWNPGAVLTQQIIESTMEHRADDPAQQLFLSITTAMREAMLVVLRASRFDVVAVDDLTHHPPRIHVLGIS